MLQDKVRKKISEIETDFSENKLLKFRTSLFPVFQIIKTKCETLVNHNYYLEFFRVF